MPGLLALAPAKAPRTSYDPQHIIMRMVDRHRRSCRRYTLITGQTLPPVDLCPICGAIEPETCECERICGPYLWELIEPLPPESDDVPW